MELPNPAHKGSEPLKTLLDRHPQIFAQQGAIDVFNVSLDDWVGKEKRLGVGLGPVGAHGCQFNITSDVGANFESPLSCF